jgi:hypothetical protein
MTTKADQHRRTSFTLAQARKKVEESVGGDTIEIFVEEGGEPFYIPHPYFYDTATKKALKEASELDDDDENAESAVSRVLLGDEQYDKFIAAGGSDDALSPGETDRGSPRRPRRDGRGPAGRPPGRRAGPHRGDVAALRRAPGAR